MSKLKRSEWFARDIVDHKLTIVKDDGVHRYLVCKRPDSGFYGFQITTWPGYLAISGDMGFNAWSRTSDMFAFFRGQLNGAINNSAYVSEKAVTKGIAKFDINVAHEALAEWFESRYENDENKEEYLEDLTDNMLDTEDEYDFVEAVRNHTFSDGNDISDFFGEHNLELYDYNYGWQLEAIDWAIKQYDLQKGTKKELRLDNITKVMRVIHEITKQTVRVDSTIDSVGADSLDIVEIIFGLEAAFGIEIDPDADEDGYPLPTATMREITNFVEAKL